MHQDGSASVLAELAEAADVVDVGVGADNGFDGETMAAEEFEDAGDFVARINHECLACDRIADDRAIALQHSDGNGDVDQALRDSVEGGNGVAHISRVYHSRWLIPEWGARAELLSLLSCLRGDA